MVKRFDDLTITDDFLFCKVMQDEYVCKTVLNLVLQEHIGKIKSIVYQKAFDTGTYSKGVRLDVWVGDENGHVYDIEMQTVNRKNLTKRLRYYQSAIDVSVLNKGQDYNELPDSFILFFCPFDYMQAGLPVYTFKNCCVENKMLFLQDGAVKVIINSSAADRAANAELRAFLHYMNGCVSSSLLVRTMENRIQEIKQSEVRRQEYMMMTAFEADARRDGWQEGLIAGKQEGLRAGKQEGLVEGIRKTAAALKNMGLPIEQIMQATGLTKKEVALL